MCWHIVEIKTGSVAIDGEMSAWAFYQAHKRVSVYCTRPRMADACDLADVAAVKAAEQRIQIRRGFALHH